MLVKAGRHAANAQGIAHHQNKRVYSFVDRWATPTISMDEPCKGSLCRTMQNPRR